MPNKCVIYNGCRTNYKDGPKDHVCGFPVNNPSLMEKWVRFVNRKYWEWGKGSVVCVKHFDGKLLKRYTKKVLLDWSLNPIPTIYPTNNK